MSNENKLPIPDMSNAEIITLWGHIANGETIASLDTIIRFARSIENGVASHCTHIAALPAEKPAAAAERWAVRHEVNTHANTLRAYIDELLATPPAQAAEPAQVDEVKRLVSEYAEAWLARGEGAKVDTASLLVQLHAAIDALTQRPAAPLATDVTDAQVCESWEFHKRAGIEGTGNFNLYLTAFRAGFKAARNGR